MFSNVKAPFREHKYDFIFAGAGCAALSLLMRMIKSGKFSEKKILLIDREPKTRNDRTWCFWEKDDGFFEPIVFNKWDQLSFFSDEYSATMDISPYQYKMIRGIDFYNYCFDEIRRHENIGVVYGEFGFVSGHQEGTTVSLDGQQYLVENSIIFNSIPPQPKQVGKRLLQHFKGWYVETAEEIFNPGAATIMDFRVHQEHGTSFIYILPFSKTKALVEYTVFSKNILEPHQYDEELKKYFNEFLKTGNYKIQESEFGIIPMTDEKFSFWRDGAFHIGTAGGQTKASSGYTFQFIQKQSQQITDCLVNGDSLLTLLPPPKRFRFYDNVLLHVLYHNKLQGKKVFTRLFKKNRPQAVLRFLDNESSLKEELGIIATLPTLPFLKAAINQL